MKTGSFWSWSLGVGLLALPLIGGCFRTVPPPAKPAALAEATVIETEPDIALTGVPGTNAAQPLLQTNVEEATVRPVPAEFVLPPNVQPAKALADVIRLAQAGAEEGVLLTFVTNSSSTFNPRADDLVYLKDIGVPDSVVSAMLQRDQKLKAAAPAATNAPAPAVATAPEAAAPVPYAAAPTPVAGPAVPTEPAPTLPPPDYVPESAPPPPTEEIYPDFYEALAPYGSWVIVDGYGYCWQPAVVGPNPGWQPYFDGGCWVYTDCGWYWRSDYTWGWAPFHYGRWFHHHHWGWCWQPDRVWSPAWVCWRHNDSHCGWAPLPPGVHYTVTGGLTDSHHQVAQLSPQHFRFVEWRYFRDQNLAQHSLSRQLGDRIYSQTAAVTHFSSTHGRVVNDAIAPERVAAATHTTVTRVSLRDVRPTVTTGGRADQLDTSGRTLSVYRPQVAPAALKPAALGRAPATKPLVTTTTGGRNTPSAPAQHTVTGTGAAAPATPAQTTVSPRTPVSPSQPAPPSYSFRAASRYYNPTAPNTAPASRGPENSRTRLQSPKGSAEVPQNTPPVVEPARGSLPDRPGTRIQVPPTVSPGAARFNSPPAERPQREAPDTPRVRVQTPAAAPEVPRYNPPPVERSHRDSAPVERPSRVDSGSSHSESHASHAAPSTPSPSPAPSHSSGSSGSSGRSDSGSPGRR